MATRKPSVESHAVSRAYGMAITEGRTERGVTWMDGNVVTPHGLVAVLTENDPLSKRDYCRYDFVYNGRHYIRTEMVGRTRVGLVRVAAKWAAQITEEAR